MSQPNGHPIPGPLHMPPRPVYRLHFDVEEFPDMAGLVVRARSTSMDTLLRLEELQSARDADAVRECVRILADHLESWNVGDPVTGLPAAATYETLMAQDPSWSMRIVDAWGRAIQQAPPPLPPGSNSGGQFPEGSIPMEPLSASLPS